MNLIFDTSVQLATAHRLSCPLESTSVASKVVASGDPSLAARSEWSRQFVSQFRGRHPLDRIWTCIGRRSSRCCLLARKFRGGLRATRGRRAFFFRRRITTTGSPLLSSFPCKSMSKLPRVPGAVFHSRRRGRPRFQRSCFTERSLCHRPRRGTLDALLPSKVFALDAFLFSFFISFVGYLLRELTLLRRLDRRSICFQSSMYILKQQSANFWRRYLLDIIFATFALLAI